MDVMLLFHDKVYKNATLWDVIKYFTNFQNEGHNIFKHLTSQEYKTVLRDIRHAILATDLALFFGNKDRLKKIVETDSFDWNNYDHRYRMWYTLRECSLILKGVWSDFSDF